MTQPTHTHKTQGGRYIELEALHGSGPKEGQQVVVYLDLDRGVKSFTAADDWQAHWRPVAIDDCTVCMGTGRDAIKGNAAQPCGGCYGLGKVMKNGETPTDLWQLAEIAGRIIQRQRTTLQRLHTLEAMPEVKAIIHQRHDGAVARDERKWREGRGHGPGGQRRTGD